MGNLGANNQIRNFSDLDEDALNAIMKIYQEIYFLVATSCWRKGFTISSADLLLK